MCLLCRSEIGLVSHQKKQQWKAVSDGKNNNAKRCVCLWGQEERKVTESRSYIYGKRLWAFDTSAHHLLIHIMASTGHVNHHAHTHTHTALSAASIVGWPVDEPVMANIDRTGG